jgi:BirA family biotin operon repressor/biotin-[acetyl-CoA-carboxylase] ligase
VTDSEGAGSPGDDDGTGNGRRRTRRALLDALAAADGPVSGPALAADLGVSRAAVWKHVERLRESGFAIESGPDGYRVSGVPEYGEAAIAFGLAAP